MPHPRAIQRMTTLVLLLVIACVLMLASHTRAQAPQLQYGDRVTGEIAAGSTPDSWHFGGGKDDRVAIRLERLEGDVILALRMRDSSGQIVLDIAWPSSEELVAEAEVRLAAGGEHTLEVSARQGTGTYALSLILAQAGSAATRADIALSYGQSVEAKLTVDNPFDAWSFRGEVGEVVDAFLTPLTEGFNPHLALISPTGTTLGTGATPSAVRLPMGGIYTLDVRAPDGSTGTYRLALRLRSSPVDDTTFDAAALDLSTPLRGRLTSDAPSALYRITASGTLALALDLADAEARADVTVMTQNRAALDTLSGIGQIRGVVALGGQTTVWLEVVSPDVSPNQSVEFALRLDRLRHAQRDARPLRFDTVQRASLSTEPNTWFLDARGGDLIELSLQPVEVSSAGLLQLYDPQGELLLQRRVDAGFRLPLLLEQTGYYEMALQSVGGGSYAISATRLGAQGIPFDLLLNETARGPLGSGANRQAGAEVAARLTDVWTVDIQRADAWSFSLNSSSEDALLALRVEAPNGDVIAQGLAQPLSGEITLDAQIAAPGRYRVVVLNLSEQDVIPYTVRAAPVGGGALALGEAARGVLLEAQPEHRWVVDVAAPATVRVTLSDLAGDEAPEVTLIQPDGRIAPLSAISPAEPFSLLAQVEQSGTYALRVRLLGPSASATYRVQVTAESARAAAGPIVEGIASNEPLNATPEPLAAPVRVDPRAQILPATYPGPDVLANAQPIAIDSTVRGTVPESAGYQVWRIQVEADQRIALTTVGLAGGSAPDVTLLDEQGAVVARSFAPEQVRNTLLHRFVATGRYYVVVRYEAGGRYLLRAQDRSALDDSLSGVLPGQLIVYGETIRGELLSPNTVVPVYFFAHAGDALRAQVMQAAGAGDVILRLESLSGVTLVEAVPDAGEQGRMTLDFRVPTEGVYRLSVQPTGTAFAPGEFALHLALTGAQASVRDGGRLDGEVYGTLGAENPTDTWLFTAMAGEQVAITVEADSGGPQPLSVELADTTGAVFVRQETIIGAPEIALEGVSLPRSGVYRLVISTGRGESGAYRAELVRDTSRLSDTQHALPLNQTVGRVLTETNLLDVWTFAGSEGDVISAEARALRGDPALLSFQIRTQNGEVLASVPADVSGRAAASQVWLPETGHYTLAIGNLSATFDGALAYELTVLLESTQARSMGAVILPGERGAGTLSGSDLRDVWLFEGQQGDVVWVEVAADGGGAAASVLTTDWHAASTAGRPSMLAVGDLDEPGKLTLEPVVLPVDGVYTVDVSAAPGDTTEYTLSLTVESASALSPELVEPPQQVEGRISPQNLREAWTFEAQRGDAVSLRLVPDSRATLAPVLTLIGPDEETLVTVRADSGAPAHLESYTLPETGLYSVAVSRRLGPLGETEGRFRLDMTLEPAEQVATRLLRYEQIGRSWINNTSPLEVWVFEGEAGDVIEAQVDILSGTLDPLLRLYGPDGRLIAIASSDEDGAATALRHRLDTGGSYRIEVERRGGAYGPTQGNYALALNRVYRVSPIPTQHVIAYGQRVIETVDDAEPTDQWAFVGAAGDDVLASVRFLSDDAPLLLRITDPSGMVVAEGARVGMHTRIDTVTLPHSGVYVLEVRQTTDTRSAFSPYELELALAGGLAPDAGAGGLLQAAQPVYGQFNAAPAAHVWLIHVTEGERMALSLARLSGTLAIDLTVLAPDGTVLLEAAPVPGAAALSTGPIRFDDAGLYAVIVAAHEDALGLRYRLQLTDLDVARQVPDD